MILIQAGEVYFISDGRPINNFEFFRPLVSPKLYHLPSILCVFLSSVRVLGTTILQYAFLSLLSSTLVYTHTHTMNNTLVRRCC